MGRTVFIKKVANVAELKRCFNEIRHHNSTPWEQIGEDFTLEEYKQIDPMRGLFYEETMRRFMGIIPVKPNLQRLNRGADINEYGLLVRFDGAFWLEVTNQASGACSTLFMKKLDANWMGTDGKPNGFMDDDKSKVVCEGNFKALKKYLSKNL